MIKSVRKPEQIYHIVLWAVSLVFAGFVVGLGNLVIGDLPVVESRVAQAPPENPAMARLRAQSAAIEASRHSLNDRRDILKVEHEQAAHAAEAASGAFESWIQARTATTDPRQDPEVLAHTRELERLKGTEHLLQGEIDALDRQATVLDQQSAALNEAQARLEAAARPAAERARFVQEARVFGLRLAITLPMLLLAVWLVVKKRASDYWPLARGFALAALFVFFVELVPYLPSYGGYVRYALGIVLTVFAAHFLIRNMRAYLARRAAAEQQAEADRRSQVSHDEAFRKMAAKQCPGCDRPIAGMDGVDTNYCVHCGMTLYDHCHQCHTRKMAFFRYCMSCGASAQSKTEAPVS